MKLAHELIASGGIWTSEPAANFITVTIDQNDQQGGPDEIKLAARLTRAFLGVRIDCMQCHDDKFGDRWKQEDFHQLAAFFSEAEVAVSGVRDKPGVVYRSAFPRPGRGRTGKRQSALRRTFVPRKCPRLPRAKISPAGSPTRKTAAFAPGHGKPRLGPDVQPYSWRIPSTTFRSRDRSHRDWKFSPKTWRQTDSTCSA